MIHCSFFALAGLLFSIGMIINLNLTEGWTFSISGAKGIWGRTIDFGGGANFVCIYLKE